MAGVHDSVFEGRNIRQEVGGESQRQEPPKKEIHKVISSTAKKKQDGLMLRFLKELVPNGDMPLGEYLYKQVLIPTMRTTIIDVVHMMLGIKNPTKSGGGKVNTNYQAYGSSKVTTLNQSRSFNMGYQPVIVESRSDAQLILDQMADILDNYESASIADLYQLAGIPTVSTDNRYGWLSIVGSRIELTPQGYLIRLPDPKPLNV